MAESNSITTGGFYDRIADVHNLVLRLNGYKRSVAKCLESLNLGIDHNSMVLDAGSGTGIITLGFQSSGMRPKRTVALDLSHNSLAIARNQFAKDPEADSAKISVVQGNVLELPFPDLSFDLVLTCGVLEYVPLDVGLAEMARVMKSGAKLVMIPVKPSLVGSVLEFLYKFKTHPVEDVQRSASKYFKIVGNFEFPITEPMGWSKTIYLLEKP